MNEELTFSPDSNPLHTLQTALRPKESGGINRHNTLTLLSEKLASVEDQDIDALQVARLGVLSGIALDLTEINNVIRLSSGESWDEIYQTPEDANIFSITNRRNLDTAVILFRESAIASHKMRFEASAKEGMFELKVYGFIGDTRPEQVSKSEMQQLLTRAREYYKSTGQSLSEEEYFGPVKDTLARKILRRLGR